MCIVFCSFERVLHLFLEGLRNKGLDQTRSGIQTITISKVLSSQKVFVQFTILLIDIVITFHAFFSYNSQLIKSIEG